MKELAFALMVLVLFVGFCGWIAFLTAILYDMQARSYKIPIPQRWCWIQFSALSLLDFVILRLIGLNVATFVTLHIILLIGWVIGWYIKDKSVRKLHLESWFLKGSPNVILGSEPGPQVKRMRIGHWQIWVDKVHTFQYRVQRIGDNKVLTTELHQGFLEKWMVGIATATNARKLLKEELTAHTLGNVENTYSGLAMTEQEFEATMKFIATC